MLRGVLFNGLFLLNLLVRVVDLEVLLLWDVILNFGRWSSSVCLFFRVSLVLWGDFSEVLLGRMSLGTFFLGDELIPLGGTFGELVGSYLQMGSVWFWSGVSLSERSNVLCLDRLFGSMFVSVLGRIGVFSACLRAWHIPRALMGTLPVTTTSLMISYRAVGLNQLS
uniref:(northern house mosquito) hypothetical protein n=1 Tax=Culex pipiens TaxID=7175 RepID=A0A8D8F7H9_CULPI